VSRDEAPKPQPERREPRLADPSLADLSSRDYVAIGKRAVRETLADGVTDASAAIAYYTFLALPALLLTTLGLFTLLAGPAAVDTVTDRLDRVLPVEAVTLVRESLDRAIDNQSGSAALVAFGVLLALWTSTGAMTSLMRALNVAYDREETRGFLRQRVTALVMIALLAVAAALTIGLLVLGPYVSRWVGEAVGMESTISWLWWAAQWPILVGSLLAVVGAVLYLGPDVVHPRWRFLTPGSVVTVLLWLLASGGFSLYVSVFGSYNKAWGSLAAVIVLLTWLWLSSLALLVGAEVNAEAERSRELRQGRPAERRILAPARG
jgi:membrane protein